MNIQTLLAQDTVNEPYQHIVRHKAEFQDLVDTLKTIQRGRGLCAYAVDASHISQVISEWTDIPLEHILSSFDSKLASLDSLLKQNIIGQAEAMSQIAQHLQQAALQLTPHRDKPLPS